MLGDHHRSVRVVLDPGTQTIQVCAAGELDLLTAPDATAALVAVLPFAMRVRFDLTYVTFIDATGLRLVTTATKSIGLDRVTVVALAEPVRRVFEMTGLGVLLARTAHE